MSIIEKIKTGMKAQARHNISDLELIRQSAYFDAQWYREQYEINAEDDPARHYLLEGWHEGFDPSQYFLSQRYINHEPECLLSDINPLLHFEKIGQYDSGNFLSNEILLVRRSKYFDAAWYKENYMQDSRFSDPYVHYLTAGDKENANPSKMFSSIRYLLRNNDARISGQNPLVHYELCGRYDNRTIIDYIPDQLPTPGSLDEVTPQYLRKHKNIQDRRIKEQFDPQAENLVVYLVPDFNQICGGMMCICNYAHDIQKMSELENHAIIVATVSSSNTFSDYTKFNARANIFRFEQLPRHFKNIKKMILNIPEYQFVNFLFYTKTDEWAWLRNIKNTRVNIMNQNNQLMPHPYLVDMLRAVTPAMTMTCAHKSYCDPHLRSTYSMPAHFIPAEKRIDFKPAPYSEKEDLLLLSPDDHPMREMIIKAIHKACPDLKMRTIANMDFKVYLELLSKAKWMISFGEGLDGYTVESLYSGTISFSVHNSLFFDQSVPIWPNLYKTYNEMLGNIVENIKFLDNESEYNKFLQKAQEACFTERASLNYEKSLQTFYQERYDLPFEGTADKRKLLQQENPLVSIVVTTEETDGGIKTSLKALAEQHYDNVEYIFITDMKFNKKNDFTSFLNSFPPERVKIILKQGDEDKNQLMDRALKEAQGAYVTFSSLSDIFFPQKISHLLNGLDEFDISFGDMEILDKNEQIDLHQYLSGQTTINPTRLYSLDDVLRANPLYSSSALICRSLLEISPPLKIDGESISLFHWLLICSIVIGRGCNYIGKTVTYCHVPDKGPSKSSYDSMLELTARILNLFDKKLSPYQRETVKRYQNWLLLYRVLVKHTSYVSLQSFMDSNHDAFSKDMLEEMKNALKSA